MLSSNKIYLLYHNYVHECQSIFSSRKLAKEYMKKYDTDPGQAGWRIDRRYLNGDRFGDYKTRVFFYDGKGNYLSTELR